MGDCSTPAMLGGGSMPISVEQGGQDVDGVHVLMAGGSLRADASGPVNDQRVGTPPSWVSRLKRLSGVLPAQAHPHG